MDPESNCDISMYAWYNLIKNLELKNGKTKVGWIIKLNYKHCSKFSTSRYKVKSFVKETVSKDPLESLLRSKIV